LQDIGRNEDCSCMSGKKYKTCCLKRDNCLIRPSSGWSYYDETYVISKIYKESESFKLFFDNERHKVEKPIYWYVDSNLDSIMRCGELLLDEQSFAYWIRIKRSPIDIDEVFEAAHEIQHLIDKENGFPCVRLKENFRSESSNKLARILANTVGDPLANENYYNTHLIFMLTIKKQMIFTYLLLKRQMWFLRKASFGGFVFV
jgi:hypothetical protein